MPIKFNLLTNNQPEKFPIAKFDDYTELSLDNCPPVSQIKIPKTTATLAQIDGAILQIPDIVTRLNEHHIQDFSRHNHSYLFNLVNPAYPLIEQRLIHSGQINSVLLNMFKLGLFSQNTFLYSSKQTIDTRLLQYYNEDCELYPVQSNRNESIIRITNETGNANCIDVIYENELAYCQACPNGQSKLKISGRFKQHVQLQLIPHIPVLDDCKLLNKFQSLLPCHYLQANVIAADYTVEDDCYDSLKPLGFNSEQVFYSIPGSPVSSEYHTPPLLSPPLPGRTLALAAARLPVINEDKENKTTLVPLPSSLPGSRSASRTNSADPFKPK